MKKCSKCGSNMTADISIVYTSNPPMYMYTCPKCGNKEYGFCSDNYDEEDVVEDLSRVKMKEIIGKAKRMKSIKEKAIEAERNTHPLFESFRDSTCEPVSVYDQNDMIRMFEQGANYVLDEIEKELTRRMLEDYNQGAEGDEVAQGCMATMIMFVGQLKK